MGVGARGTIGRTSLPSLAKPIPALGLQKESQEALELPPAPPDIDTNLDTDDNPASAVVSF